MMSLTSTLLCLLSSTILVAGNDPWRDYYEPAANLAVPQKIAPDDKMFKILDFSKDNDHEPYSKGDYYTSATLKAGPLPESITVCSAFMVEAWQTLFKQSRTIEGHKKLNLNSLTRSTKFEENRISF